MPSKNNAAGLGGLMEQGIEALRHRGPDDRGFHSDELAGIYIGHTRLSIIDLSAHGHQPMVSRTTGNVITFNGEIYNYSELATKLGGSLRRGAGDTEVLMALYDKYGQRTLEMLRGMFAFAVWNPTERLLTLVRDRLGKKPIYYAALPSGFYFASEINALRKLIEPACALEINHHGLMCYLEQGTFMGAETIFQQIKELRPGSVLVVDESFHINESRYWQIEWTGYQRISVAEAIEGIRERLTEAVRIRLRSDVPVGVLLSGGIDSGLITALAARGVGKVRTFCVGFDDAYFDERPMAARVARHFGTEHSEVFLDSRIDERIEDILKCYGEPFSDPSAVPTYLLSEFISGSTKVVLNGDGGDELFSGYRRHVAASLISKINAIIGPGSSRFIASILNNCLSNTGGHRSTYSNLQRICRAIAAPPSKLMTILGPDGFDDKEIKSLYREVVPMRGSISEGAMLPVDELERMICTDFESGLPDGLLVKMDIATMAHGLEARSPFLDHELVTWALSISPKDKLPGFETKPLLRALAKELLPAGVSTAPKRGFEPPLIRWVENDLRVMRDDLLLGGAGLIGTMFRRDYIESLLYGKEKLRLPRQRWAYLVWILLSVAIWEKACLH